MTMKKAKNPRPRGCIKESRRPWVVNRVTKKGVVTSLRFPTEKEREQNKQREKRRREFTHRIYLGLRAHGNYRLPKHADNNDLLKSLCDEAGWQVEEDGTICRKNFMVQTAGKNTGMVTQVSSIIPGDSSEGKSHFTASHGFTKEYAEEGGVNLTLTLLTWLQLDRQTEQIYTDLH